MHACFTSSVHFRKHLGPNWPSICDESGSVTEESDLAGLRLANCGPGSGEPCSSEATSAGALHTGSSSSWLCGLLGTSSLSGGALAVAEGRRLRDGREYGVMRRAADRRCATEKLRRGVCGAMGDGSSNADVRFMFTVCHGIRGVT